MTAPAPDGPNALSSKQIVFMVAALLLAFLVAVLGCTYMGMAMTAMGILGVVQAPEDEPRSLPGISNAAYGIGSSLGFAWAGPLVGGGTTSTFAQALWICVGIGAVSLVMSLTLRPRRRTAAPGPIALRSPR